MELPKAGGYKWNLLQLSDHVVQKIAKLLYHGILAIFQIIVEFLTEMAALLSFSFCLFFRFCFVCLFSLPLTLTAARLLLVLQ